MYDLLKSRRELEDLQRTHEAQAAELRCAELH